MEFALCESLGMAHSDFLKLSAYERKQWLYYDLVKRKKSEMWQEQAQKDRERMSKAPHKGRR